MCGICGIYNIRDKKPVQVSQIRKMCDVMAHRGPDSEGIYTENNFGFGMRRLSIIDLSTGDQPIFNEDRTISVILNGEIYNFQELRKELENKNHKFYTTSDTEVIVHLYEEYRKNCILHMRGMFAFALWDNKNHELFIARDRLGKKPLYWIQRNGSIIFASEIKSILGYLESLPAINTSAIDMYLTYQYIPSPMTIFKNINRLPPASFLTCSETGNTKIEKYWRLDWTKKTNLSFEEACIHTRHLLTEATRLRMIADVPLGAFLSGGHDSSIIVGIMSQLSDRPVQTFSIGFEDETFSELPYARLVADRFKTQHHELIVKPQFVEILPKIIWHYDQPFADTSALPSYYVSEITRKHVKVALNGDGGDENFGGYLRYKAMKGTMYFSWLFMLAGKRFMSKVASLLPQSKSRFLKQISRLLSAAAEPPHMRNLLWHCYFDNETKQRIYSREMKNVFYDTNAYDYLINAFLNARADDILDKTFCADINTYLPECLLVKMDIASMANSLEARSPFLDHKLVEFAATLPSRWKIHGLTTKYILKKTFKDILPPQILNRPKQGFGLPVGKWFGENLKDYIREILLDTKTLQRGYFDADGLRTILEEHVQGKQDHGYRLWALLVLELWHRVFIDRKSGTPWGLQ